MGGILDRWGSGRNEEADQKKRPLSDSDERGAIEAGYDATRRSNHLGARNSMMGNGEMAELEGRINRRTMELVGRFESIPSATTGAG